ARHHPRLESSLTTWTPGSTRCTWRRSIRPPSSKPWNARSGSASLSLWFQRRGQQRHGRDSLLAIDRGELSVSFRRGDGGRQDQAKDRPPPLSLPHSAKLRSGD